MQWHPRIPEGARFQVDTLCVTGDIPLVITSWRCCLGKPAHQVCLPQMLAVVEAPCCCPET